MDVPKQDRVRSDVAQLQEALDRLGYEAGRPGVFDWATQRAARSMFSDGGAALIPTKPTSAILILASL